ncbi:hypothetical protein PIB30_082444 [Stylosanthes scabra]|uniref:Uncharacterized protein n=1 Tax=Stylosanthes scabra TaxID=79078 RepID=A0ABU6QT92_9FABA|nr:hypothetical protein [Stylosanthes scabra]
MARVKQTRRRPRHTANSPPPPPPLSDTPEEDWFEEESKKKAYFNRLSQIKILLPRYVEDDAIPEDKYPNFWRLIDVQGVVCVSFAIKVFRTAVIIVELRYFSRFAAAAFATVAVEDNLNDEGQGEFE